MMFILGSGGIYVSAIVRRAILSQRHALRRVNIPNPAISVNVGALSQFSSSAGGGRRPPASKGVTAGIGAIGTGALILFGKGKYLLGALKLTKLASLGSMLLTVGTYSMFFGVPYAIGMVGLITVHETGHALVMLNRGIPFSPMVFVPFVGAAIAMKRGPQDAWEDALVAFGGPILGSIGALGCSLGGYATDSQLLFALADFGYMINLFNMLPIGMMGEYVNCLAGVCITLMKLRTKIYPLRRRRTDCWCLIAICWCRWIGARWCPCLLRNHSQPFVLHCLAGWWVANLSAIFQLWHYSSQLLQDYASAACIVDWWVLWYDCCTICSHSRKQ